MGSFLRFAFGNHRGRDSTMCTSIPIWAKGNFEPVRVRLMRGESELLWGMDTIRTLDITVRFGWNQFKVGQIALGMMTFNEKHHFVFPLVQTACASAKSNGYFGQSQNSKIAVLKAQSDFGGNSPAREVLRKQNNDYKVKWEVPKSIIPETEGSSRHTLLRVVDTISGCPGAENGICKLRKMKTLQFGWRFWRFAKEKKIWKISKM